MLQTKKVNKGLVAVAFSPNEIMIRKSGKVFYGTERTLACLLDGKLVIHEDVAEEFGIQLCYKSRNNEGVSL